MTRNDLPRRDQVIELLRGRDRALHAREMAEQLGVPEGAYLRFLELLSDMTMDRAIRALPGQRFRPPAGPSSASREGVISVHPRGFAFVSSTGFADDVYIPENAVGGAMHGDLVRVRVLARTRRGIEGWVETVLERAVLRVQGVLRRRGSSAWLEPDDARVRGPVVIEDAGDARDGLAAVVQLTRYPESRDENPEGELVAVLGEPGDPVVEMKKVLVRERIDEDFPVEAEAEAAGFPERWSDDQLGARRDLRDVDLITIDPDDARDHDDAIFVRAHETGFDAWVAIADVAQYVTQGSALDGEARRRAFSVYLPDRAVPMLPRRLSSDLCSLREGVDRLCLAVRFELDRKGVVRSSEIVEGVMRSRARLTYTGIARAMGWSEPDAGDVPLELEVLRVVKDADRLAGVLRRRRLRRGALDLQVPEPRVELDDAGAPIDVVRRAQDPGVRRAYGLIEELMIAANEAVAAWVGSRGLGTIYRVHAPPDDMKLERLVEMCGALDIAFSIEDAADPKRLSTFLGEVASHPLAEIIGMLTLRSLKQATYDSVNIGHFGLASTAYVHFTSPIRRYPDLQVHRFIKGELRGEARADETALREIATHCTRRERAVVAVEREVVDLYRALLMRGRIGSVLEGKVVDIDEGRIVVALNRPFVDVRVPMDRMGGKGFEATEDGLRAVDSRSGETVKLGEPMWVEVESVSLERRSVLGRRTWENKKRGTKRNALGIPGRPRKARRNEAKSGQKKKRR